MVNNANSPSFYSDNFIQERRELSPREFLIREAESKYRYGDDINILLNIVRNESNWDAGVCNKSIGCESGQGIFQIIPNTFKNCQNIIKTLEDVFNPYDNIRCGLHLYFEDSKGICHWQNYSGPYNEVKCD